MRTVAEEYDCVVGVDTHAATHTMTLLTATGGVVGTGRSRPVRPGYTELLLGFVTVPRPGPVWSSSKAPVPTGRS